MKKSLSIFYVLGVLVLTTLNAVALAGPKAGLILPGTGVAEVNLGSDYSSFDAVFPKRPGYDDNTQTGTSGEGCPEAVHYWIDIDLGATGVNAYFTGGRITQLSVHTPRFALPNGLKTGATVEQVKQAYPKGQQYVLLGSNSKVNGGRDLVYWVDNSNGIAFEFAWYQNKKQRLLNGIDVFAKGASFRPEGCISPPQQWKQMK